MTSDDHIYYENIHAKRKAFLRSFIAVFVLFAIITLTRLPGHTEKLAVKLCAFAAAAFTIGLIMGIYSAVKAADVKIVIGDETVDVTVGKKHGSYPLEDFERGESKAAGNAYKRTYSLIFHDSSIEPEIYNNSRDDLYILLPGISGKLFEKIADALSIRKHLVHLSYEESIPLAPFVGNVYKNREEETGLSTLIKLYVGMTIIAALFVVSAVVLYVIDFFTLFYSLLIACCGTLALILSAGFLIMLIRREKNGSVNYLRSIEFGIDSIRINDGEVINLRDVASVYITQPYLENMEFSKRVLVIEPLLLKGMSGNALKDVGLDAGGRLTDGADSRALLTYVIGNRPSPSGSERLLAEGCSCEYPALYARICRLCEKNFVLVRDYRDRWLSDLE